jgi:hypothetical protein
VARALDLSYTSASCANPGSAGLRHHTTERQCHYVVLVVFWYFDGGLNFNGAIPVTGATGTYSVPAISYYHSFGLFGRSANVTGFLPYGVGSFGGRFLAHRAKSIAPDFSTLLCVSQSTSRVAQRWPHRDSRSGNKKLC